jgi:hypothetical protein
VEVGAECVTRGAHTADAGADGDSLAAPHDDAGKVGVHRSYATAVAEHDEVSKAARIPAGEGDPAASSGTDGRSVRRGEIDAGVKPVAAGPKTVADSCADGSVERERRVGRRPTESPIGRRSRDAVGTEVSEALEPT